MTQQTDSLIQQWTTRAQAAPRQVLLPEGEDPRILEAAARANQLGVCHATIMGDETVICQLWQQGNYPGEIPPIIPTGTDHPLFDELCAQYADIRAHGTGKTPNIKAAARMLAHPIFLAAMLLHTGHTQAIVAGATHTTADVIRAAKYVIGLQENVPDVSSSFIMIGQRPEFGHNGTFVFADCGAVIEPDPRTLAGIVIASAQTARRLLNVQPSIALLSFSTRGSAAHPRIDNVREALHIVQATRPDLLIDGELQVDAAIVPDVAARKCPDSPLGGRANVLVFPDLNAGNIAYKLVERLAGAHAIGPILQGIQQPMSDLSRGCKVSDIVQSLTIMSLQD